MESIWCVSLGLFIRLYHFISIQWHFLAVVMPCHCRFLYPQSTHWFRFDGNKCLSSTLSLSRSHSHTKFKLNFQQCASKHCMYPNELSAVLWSWGIEIKNENCKFVSMYGLLCCVPIIHILKDSRFHHMSPNWTFEHISTIDLNILTAPYSIHP